MAPVTTKYLPVRQDVRKMAYIQWLTTPPGERDPKSEIELAKLMDVFPKTLYNWRQDRDFREVWETEADGVIGGVEDRKAVVLDALFATASDQRNPRHVSAAKLWLEAVGAMTPPRLDVTVSSKAVGMLSDEELERLVARGAAELQAERGSPE
jgi:hypothetical protein